MYLLPYADVGLHRCFSSSVEPKKLQQDNFDVQQLHFGYDHRIHSWRRFTPVFIVPRRVDGLRFPSQQSRCQQQGYYDRSRSNRGRRSGKRSPDFDRVRSVKRPRLCPCHKWKSWRVTALCKIRRYGPGDTGRMFNVSRCP